MENPIVHLQNLLEFYKTQADLENKKGEVGLLILNNIAMIIMINPVNNVITHKFETIDLTDMIDPKLKAE